MDKTSIALTVIGILSGGAGIWSLYELLSSLNNGFNLIFLALVIVTIGACLFCFLKATASKRAASKTSGDSTAISEKTLSAVEKNNAIVSEWMKAREKHDKMRMLEIASAAEQEKESHY